DASVGTRRGHVLRSGVAPARFLLDVGLLVGGRGSGFYRLGLTPSLLLQSTSMLMSGNLPRHLFLLTLGRSRVLTQLLRLLLGLCAKLGRLGLRLALHLGSDFAGVIAQAQSPGDALEQSAHVFSLECFVQFHSGGFKSLPGVHAGECPVVHSQGSTNANSPRPYHPG